MRTELVTTLKRQATELLADLERDREPILITQHGLPSAYLVDVESFETMQQRMKLLEGIARGERALEEGRTVSHEQAKERLSRWLKYFGPIRPSASWTKSPTTSHWTIPGPRASSSSVFSRMLSNWPTTR